MSHIFKIFFPGLGLGETTINSVAFTIGDSFPVMWYGICIAFGMLMAIVYAGWRCKQAGIKLDDLLDAAIYAIFFGIFFGARLYYYLFSDQQLDWKDYFNLRTG